MKARAIFVDVHVHSSQQEERDALGRVFRFREHVHIGALTHLQGSG